MKIFKAVAAFFARLFKNKKKFGGAVEGRMYPLEEEVYELPPIVEEDGGKNAPTIEEKELSTKKPFVPKVRSWEREYSQKQDERETLVHVRQPISIYGKEFVAAEFDATKNPNKYWRRFKRNGKMYWKKFYTESAL